MAGFVQMMKDWRRMCKAQDDGSDRDVCNTCPMGSGGCSAIYEDDGSMDYSHVEKVVTKWAAENPEPVYPTWGTWLSEKYDYDLREIMYTHIPADIAQKLGDSAEEGIT